MACLRSKLLPINLTTEHLMLQLNVTQTHKSDFNLSVCSPEIKCYNLPLNKKHTVGQSSPMYSSGGARRSIIMLYTTGIWFDSINHGKHLNPSMMGKHKIMRCTCAERTTTKSYIYKNHTKRTEIFFSKNANVFFFLLLFLNFPPMDLFTGAGRTKLYTRMYLLRPFVYQCY